MVVLSKLLRMQHSFQPILSIAVIDQSNTQNIHPGMNAKFCMSREGMQEHEQIALYVQTKEVVFELAEYLTKLRLKNEMYHRLRLGQERAFGWFGLFQNVLFFRGAFFDPRMSLSFMYLFAFIFCEASLIILQWILVGKNNQPHQEG